MNIKASAPSNIALIKYMGKVDGQGNKPTNPSFSYTLEHLRTFVEIELDANLKHDVWEPLEGTDLFRVELSEKGKERFLNHFIKIKTLFKREKEFYKVKSANNFPSDCGLASSASSFAALTECAVRAFDQDKTLSLNQIADLSRQGSGSSCRSFTGPWVEWNEDGIAKIDLPQKQILHMAIIVEEEKKAISSSEAHKKVSQSLLFNGRPQRAAQRLTNLIKAMKDQDWRKMYEISWSEFWDMHALFETSDPHFSYMHPESLLILRFVEMYWKENNDGPVCTMDAGANIHLLFRTDQKNQLLEFKSFWEKQFKIFVGQNG